MKISVVIATYNRCDVLLKTLQSLSEQTVSADEIIIVDASDQSHEHELLTYLSFPVIYLRSEPSVCKQRNTGIKAASGNLIFILDDDIILDEKYIETIRSFFIKNTDEGAVSGWVMEKNTQGEWCYEFPLKSFSSIFHSYIFKTGLWMDWDNYSNGFRRKFFRLLYPEKKNYISKAGWPVLLDFQKPVFKTPVYGLGASVIKKEWLLASPFPETFSSHGIGENYGVALGFPRPVCVLSDIKAYHHRSEQNRENKNKAYYQRVLALHYYMLSHPRFRRVNRFFLLWSLCGNILLGIKNREAGFIGVNFRLLAQLLFRQNPYKNKSLL